MAVTHHRFIALLSLFGIGLTVLLWQIMAPGIELSAGHITLTNGQDFLNYWGAPQIAQHDIHTLFAGHDYERALHQLYPQEWMELRWSYPLHSLFFFAPFAALPYGTAFACWVVLGVGLYLAMLWTMLPAGSRNPMIAWLLFSPIVIVELVTRQNGFFIGAAALAVLWLLEKKRPLTAGILLGFLTIKPQLFILWPLMLVMEKQWRCVLAASLTTAALIGLSFVVHGMDAWQQFLTVVPDTQWRIISAEEFDERRKLTHLMMPGVIPSLRILGASELLTHATQWSVSLAVFFATMRCFRRPMTCATRAMLLGSGGLLISPYGFNYDMTLLGAGMMLWWAAQPSLTRYEATLSGMAYLLPLLIYVWNIANVPLAPIILALVFCHALRKAHRDHTSLLKGPV